MSTYTSEARAHCRKRVRFSGDDSSEPSISDESALLATSVTDHSTDASDCDSDTGSELSESSEEPSDESSSDEDDAGDTETEKGDGQDAVVNLRANRGQKPTMKLDQDALGPDIRSFLNEFLPQLKAANEELEEQKKAGTLQSLDAGEEDEGAPYIEMDLGLGVLEAQDPHAANSSDSESDQSDSEGNKTETDRLGRLLGREKRNAAGIEVLRDGHTS